MPVSREDVLNHVKSISGYYADCDIRSLRRRLASSKASESKLRAELHRARQILSEHGIIDEADDNSDGDAFKG